VFSGISLDRADVLSSGLEAKQCISNNEIKNGPLLGDVYFDIFIDILLIYNVFVL
jgi:hypothetical protein